MNNFRKNKRNTTACKVTVCVATYNRHLLLRQLVEDIIQGASIDYGYEILILNDSQFSHQVETCKYLDKKYEQVRYVQNSANLGLFRNLEENFKYIRGEYVIFPGDDDYLYPGLINQQVDLLERHKDVVMISPSFRIIYKNEDIVFTRKVSWEEPYKVFEGVDVIRSYLGGKEGGEDYVFVWPSIMFRRSTLEKVGHFKGCTPIAGDTYVISKVLTQGGYCQINDVLFDFISYGDSLRALNSRKGNVFDERLKMLDDFSNYLDGLDNNKILNNLDREEFYKGLARQTLSLNGSITWTAARYEGSPIFKRLLILRMFWKSILIDRRLLLSFLPYVVLISALVLPQKAFLFLARQFTKLYKK